MEIEIDHLTDTMMRWMGRPEMEEQNWCIMFGGLRLGETDSLRGKET